MAIYGSNWKYDSVYQLMLNDSIFNPIILVCPDVSRGKEHMLCTMNQCGRTFEQKGYSYVRTYDEQTESYVDAHAYKPDIVFYTNPYKGIIDDRYYYTQFPNSLICYVNYGYYNHVHEFGCNLPFHQRMWRYFVECDSNFSFIKQHSPIKGQNCIVTGYPMYDAFIHGTSKGLNWKIQNTSYKRIIWSPHHSISNSCDDIQFSTFELYYDIMLLLAKKYHDDVQFVFKPHPLLKDSLYKLEGWGIKRTDQYYEEWANGVNTSIAEGDYVDLFNSSDAMINDSGSFTIEYLYTQKPCLLLNNFDRNNDANEVSKKAIDCWYKATTPEEIENFIRDVVIEGDDIYKTKREIFYKESLLPPHGKSVAENIIDELKKELCK
mgnify:CR=1 FL=1